MEYRRYDNETDDELIYRVAKDKDLIGTWEDVKNILNPLLGTDYGESTFRKKYQAFQRMFYANKSKFASADAERNEIDAEKRDLEREKIKFRDERNAWQRQNYIAARAEQKLDFLEERFKELGRIEFPENNDVDYDDIDEDEALIVMLSDLHIGASFSNYFGKFNTGVAKERLGTYLHKITEIGIRHHVSSVYVAGLGDYISGNIHCSIQVTNRENVIEQIKMASELITSFCYELTNSFEEVKFASVSGNHSRLDKKEDAMHDERLDDLIDWAVNSSLSHISGFSPAGTKIDTSMNIIQVNGRHYVLVHGDYDAISKNDVQDIVSMVGFKPEAVLYGHLHHAQYDEYNGIKMIRSGSLAGTGDSFTIEKRITGAPEQTVLVVNNKGVEAIYPITL